MEECYPLYKCPAHLLPSKTVTPSQIPVKLFYGVIVPAETFVSYANANQLLLPGTTRLASHREWYMAMVEVTTHFSTKFRRLLTCCVLTMNGGPAGLIGLFSNRTVPWYFYTEEDDEKALQTVKKELGLSEQVEGAWFYAEADYDYQELIPFPDLNK